MKTTLAYHIRTKEMQQNLREQHILLPRLRPIRILMSKTRSAAQWRKLAYYGPGYGRQLTKSALTICTSSTTETRV
jgi:hypothetical protein